MAVIGALTLVGAGTVGVAASESRLIEFDSMTAVSVLVKGTTNDRGITAGGAPWVIKSGTGHVDRQGHVSVKVTGLIIPILTPPHNPIANFSVTVSCLTPHRIVNLTTGLFPATTTGNSTINAKVALPHRCEDAEVFVGTTNATTGAFVWFAMSNAEDRD